MEKVLRSGLQHRDSAGNTLFRAGSYNVQAASTFARWKRLLSFFGALHILACQGTKMKPTAFQGDSPVHTVSIGEFKCWHWHASSGVYTNTSTGVTLAAKKSIFHRKYVVQVYSPDSELQGRAGAIHFRKRGHWDILPMCMYWPSGGSTEIRRNCIWKLITWAEQVIRSLPARCTPMLFLDANAKVGMQRRDGMDVKPAEGDAVGPEKPEYFNMAGFMLQDFCNRNDLAILNTYVGDSGPTFFSWHHTASRIDYILLPKTLIRHVQESQHWNRAAYQLQLNRSIPTLRDHTVLAFSVQYPGDFGTVFYPQAQWNKDALMREMISKERDDNLSLAFHTEAEHRQLEMLMRKCAQEGKVDESWEKLNDCVKETGFRFFATARRLGRYDPSAETLQWRQAVDHAWNKRKEIMESCYCEFSTNLPPIGKIFQAWYWWKQYQRADKQLGRCRFNDRKHCRERWDQELQQAKANNDTHACWVLSRMIAGTRLGPKRRFYGGVNATNPSAEVWSQHLQQAGPLGGCSGSQLTIDTAQSEVEQFEQIKYQLQNFVTTKTTIGGGCGCLCDAPSDVPLQIRFTTLAAQSNLEAMRDAAEDLEMVLKELRSAKSRKTVPHWAAPRELWLLLLSAEDHVAKKLLWLLLTAIRKARSLPQLWNLSFAVPVPKFNGKRLCHAFRLVNVLDPIGKAFNSGLWHRASSAWPHWAVGFRAHRRREQAIMQQRILQYRLRVCLYSFFTIYWDVANAFPSMDQKEIEFTIDSRNCSPRDKELLKQRHTRAMMMVEGNSGDYTILRCNTGCLQGDRTAPQQFAESYNRNLAIFDESLRQKDQHAAFLNMAIEDPQTGEQYPTALSVLADDVARTGVSISAQRALQQIGIWDEQFDLMLSRIKMGQNFSKKQISAGFFGDDCVANRKNFFLKTTILTT